MRRNIRWRIPAILLSTALASVALVGGAAAEGLSPQQQFARDIYKELVEINTVTATGDTARAAEAMAARLRAAGFPEADVQVSRRRRARAIWWRGCAAPARASRSCCSRISTSCGQPRGLVGRSVQADREGRLFLRARHRRRQVHGGGLRRQPDPLQAGGLQARARHHRGARDRRGDPRSRRRWASTGCLKNHRDLIDAEFALNEGGGVGLKDGKPIRNSVQTSEKVSVSYRLEVKNQGGHSSLPTKDNAIYRLAEGLVRLAKFSFPSSSTRPRAPSSSAPRSSRASRLAADMRAMLPVGPIPPRCRLSGCRQSRSTTRSCARPASRRCWRAGTPSTRCRSWRAPPSIAAICPASRSTGCKATLERVLADDQIAVTQLDQPVLSAPSALHEEIMGAIEKLSHEFWPGTPSCFRP